MAKTPPSWPPEPGPDNLGTDPDPVPPRPPPPRPERIPSGLPLPLDHGFTLLELLEEKPDSQLERQWRSYAQDADRPGPRAAGDGRRGKRKLNSFERWALEPYFIDEDLNAATIYNGVLPPAVPAEALRTQGIDPDNIKQSQAPLALTFGQRGKVSVWFPVFQPRMWHRFWLGVLAHELAHGAQARMGGLKPNELAEMIKRHGYENTPTEVQARWVQGGVLRGLDKRASSSRSPTTIEVPEVVLPGSARPSGSGWAWLLVLLALAKARRA